MPLLEVWLNSTSGFATSRTWFNSTSGFATSRTWFSSPHALPPQEHGSVPRTLCRLKNMVQFPARFAASRTWFSSPHALPPDSSTRSGSPEFSPVFQGRNAKSIMVYVA
jgi:hypothetical protein